MKHPPLCPSGQTFILAYPLRGERYTISKGLCIITPLYTCIPSLPAGTPPSHGVFRVVQYGKTDAELGGTALSAHWSFASLQKFGQNFVDQLQGRALNVPLLKKVRPAPLLFFLSLLLSRSPSLPLLRFQLIPPIYLSPFTCHSFPLLSLTLRHFHLHFMPYLRSSFRRLKFLLCLLLLLPLIYLFLFTCTSVSPLHLSTNFHLISVLPLPVLPPSSSAFSLSC